MEIEALKKRGFKYHIVFEKWFLEFENCTDIGVRIKNNEAIVKISVAGSNYVVVPNCKSIKQLDKLIYLFRD